MDSGQTAKEILETSLGQAPWSDATHPVLYVDPGTQMSVDYDSGAEFLGYPTLPLIDLETMQVIVPECFEIWSSTGSFEDCVAPYL